MFTHNPVELIDFGDSDKGLLPVLTASFLMISIHFLVNVCGDGPPVLKRLFVTVAIDAFNQTRYAVVEPFRMLPLEKMRLEISKEILN